MIVYCLHFDPSVSESAGPFTVDKGVRAVSTHAGQHLSKPNGNIVLYVGNWWPLYILFAGLDITYSKSDSP